MIIIYYLYYKLQNSFFFLIFLYIWRKDFFILKDQKIKSKYKFLRNEIVYDCLMILRVIYICMYISSNIYKNKYDLSVMYDMR